MDLALDIDSNDAGGAGVERVLGTQAGSIRHGRIPVTVRIFLAQHFTPEATVSFLLLASQAVEGSRGEFHQVTTKLPISEVL